MQPERPVLDQLNLVVNDMDATLAFYRALGLEIDDMPPEWAAWAPHHRNQRSPASIGGSELEFDSTAFAPEYNRGWGGGPGTIIGFRVSSREAVDETFAALIEAGHPASQPPYDAFWGARYAIVIDPDGRHVGIMSPRDPALAKPTPEPPV